MNTGAPLRTLEVYWVYWFWVSSVSFSPDGSTLASGYWARTVQLWDVNTGAPLRTLEGHTSRVTSVSFSPDGSTLASGSGDGTVRLWELTPSVTREEEQVEGDINGDGVVSMQDLLIIAGWLGHTGQNDADVNGDGVVNIQDLVFVVGRLGNAAAAPAFHPQDLAALTAADVEGWLIQAQQMALIDPVYMRGIAVLEQLLAALTPKETALLSNYPNPFNPETWIPYHLARAADVTLTIYDTQGVLVRRLDLGYQQAGYYTNRAKAAYWDGTNNAGEEVASGIYFYQLRVSSSQSIGAGEYTATKQMVIVK